MDALDLAGRTIAHFRVERRLGAGGMGIVYLAEDVLLRRRVALKVMRPEQVSDERRRARFLREARTAAGLHHPNIATIYEVGEEAETIYIAMELVPGEALREILRAGAIDVTRASRWALDIANALAKAHGAGVVHRDLKPDNVMLTPQGDVKLLDFGLAKALVADTASGDPALDATALEPVTGEGLLVGTPEYMSPEQARGAAIDVRSDVFSFGTLLYEMLAGASPFRRATVMETAIAVSRDEPERLMRLRPEIGPQLDAIVTRCLAKRAEDRFASAREIAEGLREAIGSAASLVPPSQSIEGAALTKPPPRRWARVIAPGMVAALAVAAVAAIAVGARHGATPSPAIDGAIAAAPTPQVAPAPALMERIVTQGRETNGWTYAVSPDGSRVVYADPTGIWLQPMPFGASTALPVPAADAASTVDRTFTSPETIAYVVSHAKQRSTVAWSLGLHDAAPRRLRADPIEITSASLSPDGRHFAYDTHGGLLLGTLDGGEPVRVVAAREPATMDAVTWSPSGDALVYLYLAGADDVELRWLSADGSRTTSLMKDPALVDLYGGGGIAWPARGRLLVMRYAAHESSLLELPIGANGELAGASRALFTWSDSSVSQLRTGGERVVFTKGTRNGEVDVFALSEGATELRGAPRAIFRSAWIVQPLGWLDDARLAFVEAREEFDHAIVASLDGGATAYVPGPLGGTSVLLPDGDVLHWSETDGGGCALRRHVARTGDDEPVARGALRCGTPIACARSRCIVQEIGQDLGSSFRDWTPDAGVSGDVLARAVEPETQFALSPDGRMLATWVPTSSLTIHDLSRGTSNERVLRSPKIIEGVTFTPDGAHLVVVGVDVENGASQFVIASMDLDGASRVMLTDPTRWSTCPRVSRDGRWLAVGRRNFGAQLWSLEPR